MKKIIISTIALSLTAPFAFAQQSGQSSTYGTERQQSSQTTQTNPPNVMGEQGRSGERLDTQRSESQRDQLRQDARNTGERSGMSSTRSSESSHYGQKSGSGNLDKMKSVSRNELQDRDTLDKLRDAEIVDRENNSLGSVTDIALENGQVSDVYVRVGGILGFGGDLVRIPFEALERDQQQGQDQQSSERRYRLNVQEQEFSSALDEVGQSLDLQGGQRAEVVNNESLEARETADRAIGARVTDRQGEEIGTITDLVIEDRRVVAAVLELDSDIRQSQQGNTEQWSQRSNDRQQTTAAGSQSTRGTASVGGSSTMSAGDSGAPVASQTTSGTNAPGSTGLERNPGEAGPVPSNRDTGRTTATTGTTTTTGNRGMGEQRSTQQQDRSMSSTQSMEQDSLVQIPYEELQSVEENGERTYRLNVSRSEFEDSFRRVTQQSSRMGSGRMN